MKTPIAWLRRYVDLPPETTPESLSERFASLGFPVDSVDAAPVLSGVVIGRLTAVEKHPNADRLSVCTVDVGGPQPLTIATAATNVATGRTVPVAIVGAHVLGRNEDGTTFDLAIAPRKMRGVDSAGMLCSAGELGLEPSWFEDGIMLLEDGLTPGADALDVLGLRDDVLDVEVTPNRVDALSIVGLARELAASLAVPLRLPERDETPLAASDAAFRVTIDSPDCTRFVARVFSGATDGTSPGWMRVLLALAGQRPIGTLVDISNFVMLETAQPLHFYDASRIAGRHLIARDARDGERLVTLDEAERTLDGRALVIADDGGALGLAGIKGGASSEIAPGTTDLVLEAATFAGPRIRRTATALGLRTEASSRHEKTLPPGLADFAAARAAWLLERLAGARARPPFAAGAPLAEPPAIRVRPADVERSIGVRLEPEELPRSLRSLGFAVAPATDGDGSEATGFDVRAPFWRGDVAIVADVVEEVARVIGFDRIEAVLPPVAVQHVDATPYARERAAAHALAALGYREAVTYALQPASTRERLERAGLEPSFASVEIRNPLSEDQRFLRFSLLPGLLELAARHAPAETLRAFEIGHVFHGDESGTVVETPLVAWMLALPRSSEAPAATWTDAAFGTLQGESLAFVRAIAGRDGTLARADFLGLHPGKTASLGLGDDAEAPLAIFGSADPRALAAFDVGRRVAAGFLWLDRLPARAVPAYRSPSRFPAVERDFALVVAPEVEAAAIESAMRDGGGSVVTNVRVFDEYRGPQIGAGRKSLAVRVTLQRRDATLTESDIEKIVAAMLGTLAERYEAVVRA